MTSHPTNSTNRVLLVRARDLGDQEAWYDIDQQYGESVIRQAQRAGLSRADAEDLRQHVLYRLMNVLPRFQYSSQVGRFRSYLRVLVRRVAQRWHHKQAVSRARPLLDADEPDEPVADPWESEWMQGHLQRAITTIATHVNPRSLLVLRRYLAGETTEEIAASLGMGIDAVRKARQRMRARLSAQVHCQLEAEEAPRERLE